MLTKQHQQCINMNIHKQCMKQETTNKVKTMTKDNLMTIGILTGAVLFVAEAFILLAYALGV